jgi:hypothetical protein
MESVGQPNVIAHWTASMIKSSADALVTDVNFVSKMQGSRLQRGNSLTHLIRPTQLPANCVLAFGMPASFDIEAVGSLMHVYTAHSTHSRLKDLIEEDDTMSRPLTHQDIRDLFTDFAAAIELDQTRSDDLVGRKLPFDPTSFDAGLAMLAIVTSDAFGTDEKAPAFDQCAHSASSKEELDLLCDFGIWREWRLNIRDYIVDHLLPTVNCISSGLLQELTLLASSYEPAVVRELLIDIFAEVACDHCLARQFDTAPKLVNRLIKDVRRRAAVERTNREPRSAMMQWLVFADPLRICDVTEDPSCRSGIPAAAAH